MNNSSEFFALVLNTITEEIVVIDKTGQIQFVNKSWSDFGHDNHCAIKGDWRGMNYLEECDKASAKGDEIATKASVGIRSLIEKREPLFYLEYPCHSSDEKRWFMMRVTPFQLDDKDFFVISHQNITERKLVEEEMINQAKVDGLTNIPNRRAFDEFLHEEWRRCSRLNQPISLALIDLDHFKLLNDTYGHQAGDECLVKTSLLLQNFVKRPSDLCARYGGEEFVLLWGGTTIEFAKELAEKFLIELAELKIPNSKSPIEKYVTASIGLAEITPVNGSDKSQIIEKADNALYKAKQGGRNRICC